MEIFNENEGVWRTIGGRRVFIRTGQSLSSAMRESGKFKTKSGKVKKENSSKETKEENIDKEEYELFKKAMEKPDSIDPMTENSTDWEALEKKYKDRYEKEKKYGYPSKTDKTTNETMNEAIRAKASKKSTAFKDDLPKKVEIKTQGTSNRKEVSENIQAHILEYYDSPDDFIRQMDAFDYLPTKWHAGQEIAKGGSYLIYNQDMSDFLDSLKINPKGKKFSDEKAFDMYTSLVGRESEKLYNRLQRNAYNKYMKEHPLSKMTFEDFKKSNK